jgi:hypothetical protein
LNFGALAGPKRHGPRIAIKGASSTDKGRAGAKKILEEPKRVKRETKIYSQDPQTQSEGSFWELCVFAIFFVVVFTALARTAHAAPLTKAQRARTLIAQSSSPTSTSDSDDTSSEPSRTATLPSATATGALPRSNMAAGLPEKDSNKRYVFSSSLTVETSGTFAPEKNEDRAMSGEYDFKTGVTDQKSNISAILKGGYGREYTFELEDGTDGDIVDPAFAITKTWKEGESFRSPVFDTIVLGLGGYVGASNESARGTFVGSVGPSIAVTKKIHRLTLGQKFGYSRRFYNYDIRNDGTINALNAVSSTTDLSYNFTDSLALSFETVLGYAVNIQGTGETKESSQISIDWDISKVLGTSIGVSTKRGTISDDGTYNSLRFVDAAVAQGFFDLILNF